MRDAPVVLSYINSCLVYFYLWRDKEPLYFKPALLCAETATTEQARSGGEKEALGRVCRDLGKRAQHHNGREERG